MKITFSQEELLEKRMTELGLGGAFNHWFLRFPRNNPRMIPYEPAITLKEFFILNNRVLTRHTDRCICNAAGEGFSRQSKSFQKLVTFLEKNGFSNNDWIMIDPVKKLPRNRQGNRFSFSHDKKSEILKLRFISLKLIKSKTEVFDFVVTLTGIPIPEAVTLGNVLNISQSDVDHLTGVVHAWKMPYKDIQKLRTSIERLQMKLYQMGFKQGDGPFMEISFKKQKFQQRITKKAA